MQRAGETMQGPTGVNFAQRACTRGGGGRGHGNCNAMLEVAGPSCLPSEHPQIPHITFATLGPVGSRDQACCYAAMRGCVRRGLCREQGGC